MIMFKIGSATMMTDDPDFAGDVVRYLSERLPASPDGGLVSWADDLWDFATVTDEYMDVADDCSENEFSKLY